jgi:crotonobetainyl-CoA:carnitine CoA-transferase CaiB-like acyl-CoA transferase
MTGEALPLDGITVLDLSRVLAGPYATQMLADLGAEVWKIEHPAGGDETRAWGPPFVAGTSAYYVSVNRNKRSAALDFHDDRSLAAVHRAAAAADVVVENFPAGRLKRFGLDAATMRARHPELIVCSITGYGLTGPYVERPGYDAVLQGFTGLMSVTGAEDGPPTKVGVAVVDVLTGAHAAAAVLAALVGRLRGRRGAHIDIALFEVGVASLVNLTQATLATGIAPRRHGNAHPHIVPYQTFETADGPMVVAVGNDAQWRRLCDVVEAPEWADDPRWSTNPDRVLHRADLVAELTGRLRLRSRAEWLSRLADRDVPAGAVRDLVEVMADPVLAARDMLRPLPRSGVDLLGLPWLIDARRPPLRLPPPRLGEHTVEFLRRFGA